MNTIGSEICIGEECFYLIENDGNSATMLAKYNLYVGNECTGNSSELCTAYSNPTGIQNSQMVGRHLDGSLPKKGTTPFSSDIQKGEYYSDYRGSIVEGYVNNYEVYLEQLGVKIQNARLLTKDEMIKLGCILETESCTSSQYSWLHSSTYWTGTKKDEYAIYLIVNGGYFSDSWFNDSDDFGVRPVIEVPLTEF